jgi:hypothetical protein
MRQERLLSGLDHSIKKQAKRPVAISQHVLNFGERSCDVGISHRSYPFQDVHALCTVGTPNVALGNLAIIQAHA